MDKQSSRKIMTLSFLGAAGVLYVVVNVLFKTLAGAFGPVQRLYSNVVFSNGIPVVAAILLFAILQFNPKILNWAEEVIIEVSKVVWPSRKDTVVMTVVVCVFVGIASLLLVVIDFMAKNLIQFIIR
jgi:preprotein translocase subunit SecE